MISFAKSGVKNSPNNVIFLSIIFGILFLSLLLINRGIIILSILAGIIVFILLLKKPVIGISLVILITYTGASRLILPKLFFGTTLLIIMAYLLNQFIQGELQLVRIPQNTMILAFLMIILLSIVFAVRPLEGIDPFFELIKNIIFFYLFIHVVKNQNDLEFVTWSLLISGFIACIIGIYLILSTGLVEIYLVKSRFGSVLGNPNWFASTIVPLIPISFFFSKIQRNLWLKIFLITLMLIYIFSIALSFSRSALLTTSLILLVIFYHEMKTKKIIIITPFFLLLGVSLFFPQLIERIMVRFEAIFTGRDISVNIRLDLLKAGIEMFFDHPLLGVGNGNFLHESSKYITLVENKVAHNMYLDVAAEIGLLGLVLFISIFGKTLIDVRKIIYNNQNNRVGFLAKGYYLGLICYLITGLFVSVHYYFFLWLILAFAVSIVVIETAPD